MGFEPMTSSLGIHRTPILTPSPTTPKTLPFHGYPAWFRLSGDKAKTRNANHADLRAS